ncbi:hypothetical protein MASR2M17_20180 [Aminivibrio sp.]
MGHDQGCFFRTENSWVGYLAAARTCGGPSEAGGFDLVLAGERATDGEPARWARLWEEFWDIPC